MSKTIRVGFIGSGGIAGAHIHWLRKIEGVEVVALADAKKSACEQRIKDNGLKDVAIFQDYRKLLARKDIDAVSVCTPNALHCAPTVAALKAGKHVMVEKPIAMNAKEGKAMCDAARKSGKVFSIGFQQRFRGDVQYARGLAQAGKLGEILYCRAHSLRRRGIPNWGVFGQKKLQGGGPMIDIGVHILDMSLFIMGMPQPVAASGNCYTYIGDKQSKVSSMWENWDYKTYTVEDLACGFVRFKGGATLSIEASFAAHIEKDVFATTIMGTKGGVYVGDDGVRVFTDQDGKMVNITPAFVPNVDAFGLKMKSWIEAIRGAKNPSPGEDGLTVQKVLDGIYESTKKGREVTIR